MASNLILSDFQSLNYAYSDIVTHVLSEFYEVSTSDLTFTGFVYNFIMLCEDFLRAKTYKAEGDRQAKYLNNYELYDNNIVKHQVKCLTL